MPAQDAGGQVDRLLVGVPAGEQVDILCDVARELAPNSLDSSIDFLRSGLTWMRAHDDLRGEAALIMCQAQLLEVHSEALYDRQQALNSYLDVLALCQELGDIACQARASYHIGRGYMQFEEREQAMINLFKALALYRVIQDTLQMIRCSSDLGQLFQSSGGGTEGIAYATKALELATRSHRDTLRAQILLQIGSYHIQSNAYTEALPLLQEVQEHYPTLLPVYQRNTVLNRLADASLGLMRLADAQAFYATALRQATAQGHVQGQAESYSGLARLALHGNRLADARRYLDSSIVLCRDIRYKDLLLDNYRSYLDMLVRDKDFDRFLLLHRQYEQLRDSIEGVQVRQQLMRQEILYQKQQREDAQRILQAELTTRRIQVQFAAVLGGLLFILALILYRQYRQKQRINLRLEQLVTDRTHELERANNDLDTFAYRTAHDIRGPVASLLGLCQIAGIDPSQESQQRYLGLIRQVAMGMDKMLERFLEVINIKHATLEPERIPVGAFCRHHLDEMKAQGLLDNVQTDLILPREIEVWSDVKLLRIILRNILENAVAYRRTTLCTVARIRLTVSTLNNNQLHLSICDNGIGIEPHVASHMFEMFFRGTTRSQSLGLGLYAVRLASEKLRATVYHNAANRAETEFVVLLPFQLT
ncbi:MAG: hypothetical protein OHK0039_27150 [Bacteroidia bacterium]